MTSIYQKTLILLITFLFSYQAHAIVQFRGHYGLGQPDGRHSESIDSKALGADVIVSLPLIPIVFGLRYEKITTDDRFTTNTEKVDLNRIAILGGYRLIDTLLFVGVLGSLGIINDGEIKYKNNFTGTTFDSEIDMSTNLSVAVEGGVKLNDFILGLELGYMHGEDKENDFDFNGTYGKAILGYEF